MRRLAFLLFAIAALPCAAAERTPRVHALVHARVVPSPGVVLDDATIVVRDGVIESVGRGVAVPADARSWDLRGRTVYAGLVEPWLDRTPAPAPRPGGMGGGAPAAPVPPAAPAPRGAAHANALVHPETDLSETMDLGREALEELRAVGFTAAHLVPGSGVFRGRSALVLLRDGTAADQLLVPRVAQVMAFDTNRGGPGQPAGYPNSLMGSVALARQTLSDAGWARAANTAWMGNRRLERPYDDESLRALAAVLAPSGKQPVWFAAHDVLACLRADALLREFSCDAVLLGSGDEYRQIDALRATKRPLVLQVNYPEPPRVDDDDEALDVDLEALRHWDVATENPQRVHAAGIPFAFTSQGLRKRGALWSRIRAAIERGLPADVALGALTTEPARLLGAAARLGTIEAGKIANLTVTDGDLFADKTRVLEVWVDGDRYENALRGDLESVRGDWTLAFEVGGAKRSQTLHVEGGEWTLGARLEDQGTTQALDGVRFTRGELSARQGSDLLRLVPGQGALAGAWWFAGGTSASVQGTKVVPEGGDAAKPGTPPVVAPAAAPAASVAVSAPWPPRPEPAPRAVLVRGGTVWTCGPQGRLENADVLAVGGKITAVGRGLQAPPGAVVVDAAGKQVTPGLVDCHSHSDMVGSVNEGSNICTAEVRTADILNSESIAIYRELAGGLTVANQLHGSANSIGGQNAVIKLRWGAAPAGLLFAAAPPGIKFALGENPKQSNWDDRNNRYPQSRAGVEQSIRERFIAARDYMREADEFKAGKTKIPPRRDLQLEAVAEILRGERLVHCHSYRADEILMMMRVAEEFGFRVATFQHVLEGYKVADELAQHGAGASGFSDWWAYKFEVYDAIPYAGALMRERGVLVSFNSDSSELARRLNLEAAKAVKYGAVPEEDALKFETWNPAKQLRIESRVGSLEPGKDADFVVWSQSPLASTTVCEQTWIEGRKYFDRAADLAARAGMETERTALVAKARDARKKMKPEDQGGFGTWHPSYWASDEAASCHEEAQP